MARAARYRMPLMLAIIGGESQRFAPFVDLYHRALEALDAPRLPVGVHSPGHVADSDEQAREQLWPLHETDPRPHRRRAGVGTNATSSSSTMTPDLTGPSTSGSPETVARKIATTAEALGLTRFDMKYSAGRLPHLNLMRSIELYGGRVIPLVRDMLS